MVSIHQIKGLDERLNTLQGNIPVDVSELVNDAGYLTSADIAGFIGSVKLEVVQELPTTNIKNNIIYVMRNTDTEGNDLYTEYIYVNGSWEVLGSRRLDLSGYLPRDQFEIELVRAQEQTTAVDGTTIMVGDNVLKITMAGQTYNVLVNRGTDYELRIQALENTVGTQVLTGFTTGTNVGDIAATDTLLAALAKLQNRIAFIEQNAIFADNS